MDVPGNQPTIRLRSRLRPWILAAVVVFIIAEIVAFSPSPLEESTSSREEDPKNLVNDLGTGTLATNIPKDRIPEYSVDRFDYVSTQGGVKQWKLVAEKAFLYNSEKLVHARTVTAYLHNPDGQITVVTGKEAKYYMNQRDLEVYGNVVTRFPDGFVTESEYMHYKPREKRLFVPETYLVKGHGKQPGGQDLAFKSMGLDYGMGDFKIYLPQAVRLETMKPAAAASSPDEKTVIESDHCVIYRNQQLARFTMDSKKPLSKRYVNITQPNLFVRSRRADLNYGDYSQLIQYMVAYEDVLIKEEGRDDNSLKYATAGQADFATKRNVIILRQFPQVYQNNDTVTGDIIVLHRDTDIVEVEHSNAFSEGKSSE
jgi:LPS export ABC transporter protein LptC